MQVSVEAGEGLLRKMSVEVPTETVEAEVENRLQSLKGRVKIDQTKLADPTVEIKEIAVVEEGV